MVAWPQPWMLRMVYSSMASTMELEDGFWYMTSTMELEDGCGSMSSTMELEDGLW